jgi:hypothetical protein
MPKGNNTSLTKAILRDEKADDLFLFNHRVCTSVCSSHILAILNTIFRSMGHLVVK